jgi:hypothetical protein
VYTPNIYPDKPNRKYFECSLTPRSVVVYTVVYITQLLLKLLPPGPSVLLELLSLLFNFPLLLPIIGSRTRHCYFDYPGTSRQTLDYLIQPMVSALSSSSPVLSANLHHANGNLFLLSPPLPQKFPTAYPLDVTTTRLP